MGIRFHGVVFLHRLLKPIHQHPVGFKGTPACPVVVGVIKQLRSSPEGIGQRQMLHLRRPIDGINQRFILIAAVSGSPPGGGNQAQGNGHALVLGKSLHHPRPAVQGIIICLNRAAYQLAVHHPDVLAALQSQRPLKVGVQPHKPVPPGHLVGHVIFHLVPKTTGEQIWGGEGRCLGQIPLFQR